MADRDDSDREVLTSLPRSRPARRSARRGERAAGGDGAQTRRGVDEPAAKAAAAKAAGATEPDSERPRVPPARKVPPAGYAAPRARPEEPSLPAAAELLSTTIQAAAELAQIGLAVGRQTLQSMLERLPKP